MKSGSLNFLEPSGPLKACNGTDLPFTNSLIKNVCYLDVINSVRWYKNTRNGKGKGTAVPLQAWSGPEGSRKLRFPDFMTTAQDGGKVVSFTHRPPLPAGNAPDTYFC